MISFCVTLCLLCLVEPACTGLQSDSVKKENDFVTRVHVIFMNHLDVGYASFIGNVINKYFTQYFSHAIELAADLKKFGYVETFIYTSHPWLVSLYLDCPPNFVLNNIKIKCPNATEKAGFISAVKAGYITWHAGPMNLQVEMADDWLFSAGLDMSAELDKQFNISRPLRVLSQRDVPGMTEAAISVLVKKGVSVVSVGVNNATPPPALPPLFIWKKGTDSVMATWHPGGYPDDPGKYPSSPMGLSRRDCLVTPGFNEALCFAFRTDNTGPPSDIQEVLSYYEILRAEFPSAELKASRLEDYFQMVDKVKDKLPVIIGEIGDVWIQGVASDPRKCAEYRAVSRAIKECLIVGKCSMSDERLKNATRFLIKLPEHTWGLPSEYDTVHWTNQEFYKLRLKSQNFIDNANAWREQREFIHLTLEALADHPVATDIQKELKNLIPSKPDLTGFVVVSDHQKVFHCPNGNVKSLKFGSDGSITSLNYYGIDWASEEYSLSRFTYTTYNETDFIDFGKMWNYASYSPGYVKSNVTASAHPESKIWPFGLTSLYLNKDAECDFYISVEAKYDKAVSYYGAPRIVWLRYTVRTASSNEIFHSMTPGIDVELQWFNKTITRLPESVSLLFNVIPQRSHRWLVWKLNQPIDPLNVTLNGSHYQHVLDDRGAAYTGQTSTLRITSPDVPLACPIVSGEKPHVFPAPLVPISKPLTGMAYNIYNNIWSTNYIMWYPYADESDAHFKARFSIQLTGESAI